MHWTEFPPDAHRGYDVGAAVLEIHQSSNVVFFFFQFCCLNQVRMIDVDTDIYHWSPFAPLASRSSVVRRVHSTGLQVMLPTPDFSMPYNVICLSGTVWALFFGNVFNALIRRYGQLRKGLCLKSKISFFFS